MKYIIYFSQFIVIIFFKIIALGYRLVNRKRIFLIGERHTEAKDNGYHLFKYVRENYPDVKLYYVIERNAPDITKIHSLGNIVYYNTLRHYLYFVLAEKLICAHQGSCIPNSPVCWKLLHSFFLNKKRIYIKHGIIKEKISSHMYSNTKFEKIICGAKPEYDFIKKELGYPEESVKYLGLCRFDNLHQFQTKRQIFMMFTWRQWFGLECTIKDLQKNKEMFSKSQYFNTIKSLLNDQRLIEYLETNNFELVFHPHHEIQRFNSLFNTTSKNIIIANENEYDVQQLLKESELLITDYSSIAFDFAYMKKPVIYYQFDQVEYNKKHYGKGYFDYEKHGFGPIATTQEELIKYLTNVVDYTMYKQRIKLFYPIYDQKNCERHYQEIFNA